MSRDREQLVAAQDHQRGCPVETWVDGAYRVRCGFGVDECHRHGRFPVLQAFRLQLPRWDVKDVRGRRQRITNTVIATVAVLARNARIPTSEHLTVELVWAPERANRNRDSDNLWPLLKVLCDALARGPIKRGRGRPGLDLVPDDTPRWMTKLSPRIAEPGEHDHGLWLHILATTAATPAPVPQERTP